MTCLCIVHDIYFFLAIWHEQAIPAYPSLSAFKAMAYHCGHSPYPFYMSFLGTLSLQPQAERLIEAARLQHTAVHRAQGLTRGAFDPKLCSDTVEL